MDFVILNGKEDNIYLQVKFKVHTRTHTSVSNDKDMRKKKENDVKICTKRRYTTTMKIEANKKQQQIRRTFMSRSQYVATGLYSHKQQRRLNILVTNTID